MIYRMQHNMVSISPADYLAPVQSSRSKSGHDQMYQVPYPRTDVYKYSFFPAIVRMWKWNALPASVIQSGTLSFKAGSGQIVGERGGTAFPFRFWRGNAVLLAYTLTATYNTSNRKNVR